MSWWKRFFSTPEPVVPERRGVRAAMGQTSDVIGEAARRVPFRGKVRLVQERHNVSATAGDLSEGGVFVQTRHPPGVGTKVRVVLELDNQVTLHVEACVRWIKVDDKARVLGCGMLFEPLSVQTRAAVRRALDVLESQQQEQQTTPAATQAWSTPCMNA